MRAAVRLSPERAEELREALGPACEKGQVLGHVIQIADGDAPHTPRGCPFQAWSLGELLRVGAIVEAGLAEPQSPAARRSA